MYTYFDGKQSQSFTIFIVAATVRKIAATMLFLFGPIYIYEILGSNMNAATLYFMVASVLYLLCLGFGSQLFNIIGFKRSLVVGLVSVALYSVTFALMTPENVFWTVPLSLLFFTGFRFFHWVPYLTDFSKFTNENERGRQTGFLSATGSVVGIVMPIVGGWIIATFGLSVLFGTVTAIYVLTIIPYSLLPHTEETYTWNAWETWKEFFKNARTRVLTAHMAVGAEGLIRVFLWPVFIFELLEGNYFEVGALSTGIVLVTIVIRLVTGKYIDKHKDNDHLLTWGSVFYALGWIFKIFIFTAFHIFIVDVYHKILFALKQTPFNALSFDIAADEGAYVDEYTVLREMSIHAGRVIMSLLIFALLPFFAFKWVFVFAAVASIVMVFITTRDLDIRVVNT